MIKKRKRKRWRGKKWRRRKRRRKGQVGKGGWVEKEEEGEEDIGRRRRRI